MTIYYDGRNFDKKTGTGIYYAMFNGIKPKNVPSGDKIFTVVQYQTDDCDLGAAKGPEHWVLAKPPRKKGCYEPSKNKLVPVDVAIKGQEDLTEEELSLIHI